MFFFFKQKTAYEMRISDWSSDVCSSDLAELAALIDFTAIGVEMQRVGAGQIGGIGRAAIDLEIGELDQQVRFGLNLEARLILLAVRRREDFGRIVGRRRGRRRFLQTLDRKSTRLNSSH